jgi:peptidoglycan/xylan/chitin deacetylase (PgdA/CDA1 family)
MSVRGRWFRRTALGMAAATVAALVVLIVQPLWVFAVLARLEPRIVWRVNTTQPLVALSFDDGPAPDHTPQVLAILARHRAHATFFLIGDRAALYPEWVATLRSSGHEVGNHYISIHSATRATDDEFVSDLTRTEQILRLRGPLKLFRPPGGRIRSSELRLAEEHGYRVVLGSAYPYDPDHPPSSYIRWLVTKNLAPGVIVILHDGIADPSRMISALDSILTAGEQEGYQFVTVGELLASQ